MVFTGSDQVNFQVGDTVGFTWTNEGAIAFEDSSNDFIYCRGETTQPAVGSTFTLREGSGGNRIYSLQAIYNPSVSGK